MREAYFHEDDYDQIEVLPIAAWNYCLAQLQEMDKFSNEHSNGIGWTDIYIRDGDRPRKESLNIKVKDLTAGLGKILTPYDKVFTGYSSYREEAQSVLAFGSETSCIIFAGYDSNDIVDDVWLDFGIVTQEDKELALTGLLNLGSICEMILVDWALGKIIKLSNPDEIKSYFDLREKSRANVLKAIHPQIDTPQKKENIKTHKKLPLVAVFSFIYRFFVHVITTIALRGNKRIISGEITACDIERYEDDWEFEEFHIGYRYEFNGKMFTGSDHFVLNTSHIGWASQGNLLGFPKIDFTRKNVVDCLKPGSKINIILLPTIPSIHRPEYPPIIYQAVEF
jgi:hypothetical protein